MPPLLKKIKKKAKPYFKRCPKNLFSCLGIISIILLLVVFVFSAKLSLKSLSSQGFYFLTANASNKLFSQSLFAKPVSNFLMESPEMTLVQGNSMIGTSPPATVSPQVLGGLIGGADVISNPEPGGDMMEYIVESGETLSSIAEKFDISLNTILWANNLSSRSVIKKDQKLIILPVSGVIHLVRKGDTIGTLARTYKADLEGIVEFNNLSGEGDIFIGDVLVIPGGKMPARIPQVASIPIGESYFIFPAQGKITQGLHGIFRNAIDIADKCGKPVVAAAGGAVQRAGTIRIGGRMITILHPNGVVTYYGHLSTIAVVPGQTVKTGDIIGYMGNSGYTLGATGCHLHFEVRGAPNFLSQYRVGSYLSWKR